MLLEIIAMALFVVSCVLCTMAYNIYSELKKLRLGRDESIQYFREWI